MDNQRIAQVFEEIGAILEISDANRFRVLAYQKAAQIISDLGRDVGDIYQAEGEKGLMDIPGIGKDLALKIQELLEKGKCEYHQELLKKFDHGLLDMLKVRGVGPKKVKLFYTNLGINSIEKLKKAAEEGQLRDLPKMGEKSEAEILIALKDYDRHIERANLQVAFTQANEIIKYMEKCKGVEKVTYAGSLRRMKETVGDLDILVAGKNIETIMDYAVKFPEITKVLAKGETKTSFLLASGLQVDVRVIAKEVFGAALHYFTGSKEHNVVLRDRAKKMGLKVNEYGVKN
jgi:DNA polymerase (family 10)